MSLYPPHGTASGRSRILRCLALIGMLLAAGCQRGFHRAAKLPPEFQAPPNISALSLDLSKVGNSTSSSDLIQTGDILNVSVATGLENNREELTEWPLRVADDGTVNVPLVGQIYLAGLPLARADHAIRQASIERGLFRNPNVAVRLGKAKTHKVAVMGAVAEPGTYELPVANSDFLSAIAAAGGLAENADTSVEIRHPPQSLPEGRPENGNFAEGVTTASYSGNSMAARTQSIDLVSATAGEPIDYHLEDGSVVMVMKRPLRAVYVGGLVKLADQYEMPADTDLYLLDAIAMAGGRTLEVADQVTVVRRVADNPDPVVIRASIRKATANGKANIKLAPGDVVKVDETPVTFTVQAVRDLFRFGFSAANPLF